MEYQNFRQTALRELDELQHNRFLAAVQSEKTPSFYFMTAGNYPIFAMIEGKQLLLAEEGIDVGGIDQLLLALEQQSAIFNSIFATTELVETLLDKYSKVGQLSIAFYLLSLTEVKMPSSLPQGELVLAQKQDLEKAFEWIQAFFKEVLPQNRSTERILQQTEKLIKNQDLYFWKSNNQFLSMAAVVRHLSKGKAISHVYTPPKHRGKGLASAIVAKLSQQLLDQGATYCCLFTDQMNPYSNKIYERIGYQPIASFLEYSFGD